MKVDVVTDIDVEFGKWSWWSKWVDICIYNYGSQTHLVQMKVSRKNKKKFRSVCCTGFTSYRQVTAISVGNLTQMKSE